MKNSIKNGLLYIGVIYMIVIIIMMFISYSKATTIIEFSNSNGFQEKINSYKERVTNLNNSSCKTYMNSLVNKIEKDIHTEKISLKEYYELINSEDSLLFYYPKVTEECKSVTNEMMHDANMPMMFLTPNVITDEIVQDYIYQYELNLSDYRTRDINLANLVPVENNIRIQNELQIIEKLLSIINWENEV